MNHDYWTKKLRDAQAELDTARTRTEVNAAAKKLQRAKAELKALEQAPKAKVRSVAADPPPA